MENKVDMRRRLFSFRPNTIAITCVLVLFIYTQCALATAATRTAESLNKLSKADCIALIKSFFEQYMEKLGNIDVTSETRIYNCEFRNGRLGKQVADSGWYQFHLLRIGGAYRLEAKWFLSQKSTEPETTTTANFVEKEGFSRRVGANRKLSGVFGRIDVEHVPSIKNNRLVYLLTGSFDDDGAFLFKSLVQDADTWSMDIEHQKNVVIISHPYRLPHKEEPVGTRKVYCDVSKGMMPVKIELDWRDNMVGSGIWREERIVLDQCMLVDGLWMPGRIEERVRASPLGPDVCCIYLTEIKKVALGQVKQEDLNVVFPLGTRVVDAIKGVYYTAGADGLPANGIITRVGSMAEGVAPALPQTERRWPLIGTSIALICLVTVFFVRRRWRRRCL